MCADFLRDLQEKCREASNQLPTIGGMKGSLDALISQASDGIPYLTGPQDRPAEIRRQPKFGAPPEEDLGGRPFGESRESRESREGAPENPRDAQKDPQPEFHRTPQPPLEFGLDSL